MHSEVTRSIVTAYPDLNMGQVREILKDMQLAQSRIDIEDVEAWDEHLSVWCELIDGVSGWQRLEKMLLVHLGTHAPTDDDLDDVKEFLLGYGHIDEDNFWDFPPAHVATMLEEAIDHHTLMWQQMGYSQALASISKRREADEVEPDLHIATEPPTPTLTRQHLSVLEAHEKAWPVRLTLEAIHNDFSTRTNFELVKYLLEQGLLDRSSQKSGTQLTIPGRQLLSASRRQQKIL